MSEEVRTLEAGNCTLVARFRDDGWRGALWVDRRIESRVQGESVEDVWEQLTQLLYLRQEHLAKARAGREPSGQEVCQALLRIESKLPKSYKLMLRAHLRSPEHRITATQLAEAAGYASYGGANLHYGLLGSMLYAEIPTELPTNPKTGRPVMTFALATGERKSPGEDHWVWKLRPHVADGLRLAKIL